MKKTKLTIACALAALAFVTCKKQAPSPSASNNDVEPKTEQTSFRECKQATYELPNEQLKEIIERFKIIREGSGASNGQAKIILTDNIIPLDSSIFVLEAALNFDFDRGRPQGDQPETAIEKVICPTPVQYILSNGQIVVNGADIVNTYNYFADRFTEKTRGPNKIKCVDIIAHFTPEGIQFGASIIMLTYGKPAYPYIPGCSPFTTQTAMWCLMFSCSQPTPLDATVLCTNRLNCQNINGQGCFGGYVWYTNVTTSGWSGVANAYPAALYSKTNPIMICDNTVLSGGQMNNYVTGCQNLAIASLPTFPNACIVNYNITPGFIGTGTNWNNWWGLSVKYGASHCSLQVN